MIKDAYGNTRFYGIYRGVVVSTEDPAGLGRAQLRVPQVLANQITGWAWGVNPAGVLPVAPAVGAGVWVQFEGGDPSYPVWTGLFTPEVLATAPTPITEVTPGEVSTFGTGAGYFGSWYDVTTQTVTTTSVGQPVKLGIEDTAYGFSTDAGSRLRAHHAGVYNLAFSFQLHNDGGGGSGSTVEIWLVRNGIAEPDSNTRIAVPTNGPYVVAAWNFFKKMNVDDYLEIYWATDNHHIKIVENTGTMGGPKIPSAIVTINQVG